MLGLSQLASQRVMKLCITFGLDGTDAIDVDLEQYH
jgi:hypothetical protein